MIGVALIDEKRLALGRVLGLGRVGGHQRVKKRVELVGGARLGTQNAT